MNQKTITAVAISIAVVFAAVAAIVVTVRRADIARAQAEVAASAEARAEAERRTAAKNAEIAADARRKAESDKETKQLELQRVQEERQLKSEESRKQLAVQKTKEAAAEEAKSAAEQARAVAESEKAKVKAGMQALEKSKSEQAACEAKAKEAAAQLAMEKLKAEKLLAEARLLELRKVDFDTWQRNLVEWKQDLEERERALIPEKNITDLAWAGGMEDSIVDEKGNLTKLVKHKYDPARDLTIPASSRVLAGMERQRKELSETSVATNRLTVIGELTKLYERALAEDRVMDAKYYQQSILTLYPDWKYGK